MEFEKLYILALAAFFALAGCAAEPADGPGLCKLRCSDAIIGASDFKVEQLTDDLSFKCAQPGGFDTHAITSKFLITRQRVAGNGIESVAVPNISIRPATLGLHDSDVEQDGVLGVTTDDSQWCSDQCGIVTIDWRIMCPPQGDGEASISILSGGLRPDKPMRVTIEAAAFERNERGDVVTGGN